jgi:hypothetical protein
MKRYIFFGILVLFLIFPACKRKKSNKAVVAVNKSEVKQIQKTIDVKIKRYEQVLYSLPKDDLGASLKSLQSEFHFLKDNLKDPNYVNEIRNFLDYKPNTQFYFEVQKQFPNLIGMEKEFGDAFSLMKYHFPDAVVPHVYTAISGLYYEMPILFYDSTLIIALDMYLGKNYKPYKQLGMDVPKFIIQRFSREYILADCFKEIAYNSLKFNNYQGTLLDEMILEGKRLLFAELVLPQTPDSIIFPFSQEKIQWAMQNEANILGYLIEKKFLYSRDNTVIRKLVKEAPFTSFFGNQSPGRVGAWIGWQICRSWVQTNPNKPISELMNELDAQKILTESKYKPKK